MGLVWGNGVLLADAVPGSQAEWIERAAAVVHEAFVAEETFWDEGVGVAEVEGGAVGCYHMD